MIRRQTSLSKNIVQFCRFLRQKDFMISVDEEVSVLNALGLIDYGSNRIFRLALKSLLCKSPSQLQEFDKLFDQYWKEVDKAIDSKIKKTAHPISKPSPKDAAFKALQSWLHSNRNDETEQTASYSVRESLTEKDFSTVPAGEMDELTRIITSISKKLAAAISRRYRKSKIINLPDMRRTLRLNMRWGGELLEIAFRKPKKNRTKLVILCDVSKSMDLYSVFLLQFMYAFQHLYPKMETFTFGTSLQCITPVFRQHDFATAFRSLNSYTESWSGGTRIGESLDTFVKEYARPALNKHTIVIILSDGWDTGEIPLLQRSMEKIRSRSKKIIWLNPLAGYASYRPDAAGMQAALPFIDVFASVHNVDSLRKLGKYL